MNARLERASAQNRIDFENWRRYASTRYVGHTLDLYSYSIAKFLAYWGERRLAELDEPGVWKWVDVLQTECRHLQRSGLSHNEGFLCHKKVFARAEAPPAACGYQVCKLFQPLHPIAVAGHLKAVASFYSFLQRRGYVAVNPFKAVLQDYAKEYPDRKFMGKRRQPTLQEVVRLINGTSNPRNKFLYALLAKTGLRISEALALTVEDVNLQARTIRVHPHPKRGGKCVAFVDKELLEIYLRYGEWRELHVKRTDGKPLTEALIISESTGLALGEGRVNSYIFKNDIERLGLADWAAGKESRITPHCLRHFFVGVLLRSGCSEFYIKHLRGDRINDVIGVYHDPTDEELGEQYVRHMPLFGIT